MIAEPAAASVTSGTASASAETAAAGATAHIRLPADRFYWALLDDAALPANIHSPRARRQLGYAFEAVLPGIAIEDVHAAYQRVSGTKGTPQSLEAGPRGIIACGMVATDLRALTPAETLSLTPSEYPPFIRDRVQVAEGSTQADPNKLNLLIGMAEPKPLRRQRRRWVLETVMLLALCTAAITVGVERRVRSLRSESASIRLQQEELITQVVGVGSGGGAATGQSGQPSALRLIAELRRLEQTRSGQPQGAAAGTMHADTSCALSLSDLLTRWPNQLHITTESISITPTAITLRGRAPSMSDVQALANALSSIGNGWAIQQPQSELQRDQVSLTVRLVRSAGRPAPGSSSSASTAPGPQGGSSSGAGDS